jgi:hypothetical protein
MSKTKPQRPKQRSMTFSERTLSAQAEIARRRGDNVTRRGMLDAIDRLHCPRCAVLITVPTDISTASPMWDHAYATHDMYTDH